MFNLIYSPIMCLILNLIFSLFPSMTAKTCSGGLVLFGSLGQKVLTKIIIINYHSCIENTLSFIESVPIILTFCKLYMGPPGHISHSHLQVEKFRYNNHTPEMILS